jgi:hypothetical protein
VQLVEEPAPDPQPEPPSIDAARLAGALEELEQTMRQLRDKLGGSVDGRLRLLEHQRERIVDQIADAVVARLDARPESTVDRGWRSTASRWLSG